MTSSDEARSVNPWEEREDRGFVRAFGETVWAVVRRPRRLFAATRPECGVKAPLLFGVLVAMAGFVVEAVVLVLVQLLTPDLLPGDLARGSVVVIGGRELSTLPAWLASALGCQAAFLLSPVLAVAYTVLVLAWAGVVHLGVLVLQRGRGRRAGFAGTMAAVGYGASLSLVQVVPFFGDLVFVVGTVVLSAIGLQEIHGTGRASSFVVAGLPILLPVVVALARLAVS